MSELAALFQNVYKLFRRPIFEESEGKDHFWRPYQPNVRKLHSGRLGAQFFPIIGKLLFLEPDEGVVCFDK
jgi:hypothetical protein